ncbi:MAG: gliding motility protein GldM [Bernardetiaceae bacterium]|nr:gliding motility protein GldM [Bernardetiaceae bacterium]
MGGGKETPRQKMIGIMYLVLLALLALQVQNEVLEKFYFIDESLEAARNVAQNSNAQIISGMKAAAKEKGNAVSDMAVIAKAEKAVELSNNMLKSITDIRNEIIQTMGEYDEESGGYPKAAQYDEINTIMIGREGGEKGRAYELSAKLNEYAKAVAALDPHIKDALVKSLTPELQKAVGGEFLLAIPTEKNPQYDRSKYRNAVGDYIDWENIYFRSTPMVASLAVLRQLETEVVGVAQKAVEVMKGKIGDFEISFDQVVARASAESNIVAAGTTYKATMFISATSSSIEPKMTSSVGSVKVDPTTKEGIVEFKAAPGGYDKDGLAKKTWKGSITIKNSGGQDTTLTFDKEYIVAKPVIKVQSASVQALYLGCGNELDVQVPALGSAYNPSFTATGAQVIRGAKKGEVTIVPNANAVKLSVSSDGNPIGSEDFQVRLVPKPEVLPFVGNKPANTAQGEDASRLRSLELRAVPDESFKTFLPKDARFRVTSWKITHVRGRRAMGSMNANGPTANLGSMAGNFQAGDRLFIEVEQVQRLNFQNQTSNVNMKPSFNIPIN